MKLWKPRDIDVTGGPLFSSIVRYSIPVMLATFLQTLFNAVDIMVLGNMADKVAVASVGATSVIVSLCVMTFVGLSAGTSILLSRYFGAGKEDYVKKTVGTSLWFAFGLGILLSAVAIPLATPFLRLTSCPEECVAAARLYLVIYFCAIPAIMLYNFGSAILNSIGDTQRPLFYLVISGVTNVVLNILLCLILTEKVAAVAIATFASQLIGAICVLIRLGHISGACRVNYRKVPFDRRLLGKILIHGGPCAFTTAMYPLSNLMIQSAINRLGTAAMSGNVASGSIEGFVNAFTNAFAVCTLTFLGQNLGRENKERVWKTLLYCSLLAVGLGTLLGPGVRFLCGEELLALYIPGETDAIAAGMVRMKYLLTIYFVPALNGVVLNSLKAFGYSALPALNSFITVILFRIFWMAVIYPPEQTLENLYLCYRWSWSITLLVNLLMLTVVLVRYQKGKFKRI